MWCFLVTAISKTAIVEPLGTLRSSAYRSRGFILGINSRTRARLNGSRATNNANKSVIVEFGLFPSDKIVTELWDPNSPLSKQEQKKALVEKWILPVIHCVVNCQLSCTLFIRTWFGQKDDTAGKKAADAAYRRFLIHAIQEGNPDYDSYGVDPEFIIHSEDELCSAS
ncbi:hypothetical protein EYZ11_011189 [Aspergillus tanneri]|uniref:Uncharacterized protein n=1 Tax=Aspergillus tanneri TaxID=1220188 RepID=A0A4S3J3S2_9EURO|nr:hypothetical protein EYZ11_011189 [Aspergillus tanneri]